MASWDRQPKEPKRAWEHFCIHRDFGPNRTLAKTSTLCGITEGTAKQESHLFNWTPRCDQWDAHLEAKARASYVSELEKQARQRAQGHSALFGKALQLLAKVDAAKLGEISAAMKVATDAMRLEADLSTAKTEITGAEGGPLMVVVGNSLIKAYGDSSESIAERDPASVG